MTDVFFGCYHGYMLDRNQFPTLFSIDKAKSHLDRFFTVLNENLSDKEILNPRFNDVKHFLGRATDYIFFDFDSPVRIKELYFTSPSQAKSAIKKAAKLKQTDQVKLFIQAAQELAEIQDFMKSLTVVKKVSVRTEEEKDPHYVPPIPTTAAAKRVNDILTELTDGLTLQYEDALYDAYVTNVEFAITHPRPLGERRTPSMGEMLLRLVGDKWDSKTGSYTVLKPDYKAILQENAKRDAKFAQNQFLYKNVMKLVHIIEKKGYFTHEILNGSLSEGGFWGEIKFIFADRSNFIVRNKVVGKYSQYGTGFLQFPTTFHNVVMPNGEILPGQPSEQTMNEVFSVA